VDELRRVFNNKDSGRGCRFWSSHRVTSICLDVRLHLR